MAFTEFACDSVNGSNVNAGDLASNGVVTSTNGAWSTITNIFTATSGTPFSGVSVGDFCALMADGGTIAVYISRVTAIGGGGLTLTLSSTAKSGTAPTTSATAITATTGGAWKGPNGSSGFPLTFASNNMTNAAGDNVRINMKNNGTYSVTASISPTTTQNFITIQGYTSTYGDLGQAAIDGGTTGASYQLFNPVTNELNAIDVIFGHNGSTGSAHGVVPSANCMFTRCVFHDFKGIGLFGGALACQCEAYSNGTNSGFNSVMSCVRCYSHGNTGGGFVMGSGTMSHCIADGNTTFGFQVGSNGMLLGCDAYNNGTDGIQCSAAGCVVIENCNLLLNGAYGINGNSQTVVGIIRNCGFGSGSKANTSGQTHLLAGIQSVGSVTYASGVTPWNAPTTGDFSIILAAAIAAGIGAFTETGASKTGTVAHPDIGAGQSAGGGSSTIIIVEDD